MKTIPKILSGLAIGFVAVVSLVCLCYLLGWGLDVFCDLGFNSGGRIFVGALTALVMPTVVYCLSAFCYFAMEAVQEIGR